MGKTFSSIMCAGIFMGFLCMAASAQAEGSDAAKPADEKAAAKADTKAKGKAQETCPVMGGKVNKELYVDVNGKRIYVCCSACIETIKANPDKYIKKMEAEGIVLEKLEKKAESKTATEPKAETK